MHPVETAAALKTAELLVDTREQDTVRLRRRLRDTGLPYKRQKLDFGDYSIACTLADGTVFDLSGTVAVERKMNLDELCTCFCNGRARFRREFDRARQSGAKLYLLVEGASWEDVLRGAYRSRMQPQALLASLTAWLTRYDCQLIFCTPETTGKLLREILYRELKEKLERR